MPLLAFRPNPGINREGTAYSNQGGWFDGNKIRFRMGHPEKIGGWIKATLSVFLGKCRALFQWTDLSSTPRVAIGTHLKYYIATGGNPVDVTPIRRTVTLGNNPFTTTNTSAIVTVADTGHSAGVGDYVIISGSSAVNGILAATLNVEQQIATVPDANTYTFVAGTAATSGGTGGGAAVQAQYEILTGAADEILSPGFGAGGFGGAQVGASSTGYGQASSENVLVSGIRLWSQSNFGQNLLFCPRYGALYLWDATAPNNRALALTGLASASDVPTMVTEILVSYRSRQCIAFGSTPRGGGTFDPLLIRWSDNETTQNWTPDITNNAGDIKATYGSGIVTQVQTHTEIVVFTDTALFSMQFVGTPAVWGLFLVSPNISILGPNAKVNVRDTIYWLGTNNFYVYDGHAQVLPCTVRDYVFSSINLNQSQKIYCGANTAFDEVWWHYCSANATEIDSYVIYNYKENLWSYGTLSRTAWLDMGTASYPLAAGTDGYLYSHEVGTDDGSSSPPNPITAYIQSSPFELDLQNAGHHFMHVNRVIPDVTFRQNVSSATPSVNMYLKPEDYPGGQTTGSGSGSVAWSSFGPVEQYTQQVWTRLRGRSMIFKVESTGLGAAWRLGVARFEVRPDGRR